MSPRKMFDFFRVCGRELCEAMSYKHKHLELMPNCISSVFRRSHVPEGDISPGRKAALYGTMPVAPSRPARAMASVPPACRSGSSSKTCSTLV